MTRNWDNYPTFTVLWTQYFGGERVGIEHLEGLSFDQLCALADAANLRIVNHPPGDLLALATAILLWAAETEVTVPTP